jgi:hypothetical protein
MDAVGCFISSSLLLLCLGTEGPTHFVHGVEHNTATLVNPLAYTAAREAV